MPLNPDEAANDESKTYNDEGIRRDEGDLNDIKGDLVDEDDGDEIQRPYNNKVDSHRTSDGVRRRKEDSDREQSNDLGPTSRNFSCAQPELSPIMPTGFNPLFSTNGFLPSSPYERSYQVNDVYQPGHTVQQSGFSNLQEIEASVEVESPLLIEAEFSHQQQYCVNCGLVKISSCCELAQKCIDVIYMQNKNIQNLRRVVSDLNSKDKQTQVPYSPYMGSYMGPLFCGGGSPIDLDGKQVSNRPQSDVPSMYPLPGQLGQIPNHLSPWPPNPLYPALCSAAVTGMLRYPYPFANFSSAGAMSSVPPFPLVPPHPHGGGIHPNMLHPGGLPFPNHINGQNGGPKSNSDKKLPGGDGCLKRAKSADKPSRPYVKKPLNAFMLYMKEQRAQVVAECTLKESAAINQILGRKWHNLKREEQQKYYEMARKERQLHMQMFPGWSARDNYGKRKKRKKEKTQDCMVQNPKKCRAVFGLEQQHLWCAPCRRKKKCIRYQQDGDDSEDSDCSPEQYQCSSEHGNFSQPVGNQHTNSADSTVVNSNSTSSQSDDAVSTNQSPPVQSTLNEQIKQERSPPSLPSDGNERHNPPKSMGTFHTPGYSSTSSASTSSSNSANTSSILTKSTDHSSANDTASTLTSKHRPISDEQYPPLGANGAASDGKQGYDRLSHSSESPMNNCVNNGLIGRQNLFNSPMLSPGINMNSHNSPHAFLPNFSYFAAAGIPTSPLGGLMNLPNFKSFNPMNMGLQGPGSAVPSGSHPGSSASRHSTSALEGKS